MHNEKIQQTTFTKWVKETLNYKEEHDIDLKVCFRDGLMLIALLEALTSPGKIGKHSTKPPPLNLSQERDNLAVCFKFMESKNIKTVNIGESFCIAIAMHGYPERAGTTLLNLSVQRGYKNGLVNFFA